MRYWIVLAVLAIAAAQDAPASSATSEAPQELKDSKPVVFGKSMDYYRYDNTMYPIVDGYGPGGSPLPRDVSKDGPFANRNNPHYNRYKPGSKAPPAEMSASDQEAVRRHRAVYGHAHHQWTRTMPELTQVQLERYERDDSRLFERLYDAAQDSDSAELEPADAVDATNPAQVFNELLDADVVLYDHVNDRKVKGRRLVVIYLHELLQGKQRHCADVGCESMEYKLRVYSHPLAQEARVTEHYHLKDRYADEPHQRILEVYSLLVDPDSRRAVHIERVVRHRVSRHYEEPPLMSRNTLRVE